MEQVEVIQADRDVVDAKVEYAAFVTWARNWFPNTEPPSPTSHLFDAWMGSARHRQQSLPDRNSVLAEARETMERCAKIVDRNLYHQSEKIEDVPMLLRAFITRIDTALAEGSRP